MILVQRMNLYEHMEDMCMLLLRPAVLSQSLHCAIYIQQVLVVNELVVVVK